MPATVLIVDEPREAHAAQAMLADSSFHVLTADSGAHAMEILHSQVRVELLAAERVLPGAMSGATLIGKVRLFYPETSVMLMTSERDRTAYGALPVLVKPFTASYLAHRLEHLVAESRQIAESLATAFEWNRVAKGELDAARRKLQENIRQSRQQRADRFVARLREPGAAIPTILVAEDDPVFRYALCRYLTGCGLRVLEAANVDALNVSRAYSGRIDLVLADVPVSQATGMELVKTLDAERPGTQFLLMTAEEVALSGHVLRKPFELENLLVEIAGKLIRT